MIPFDSITAWRSHAPWTFDAQVEQDLVLSRALVELFRDPLLADELAFRGGTALHKLYLRPAVRYSDDIDLVRRNTGPAGDIMSAIHDRLNPWLGRPKVKQGEGRITFVYRFNSEASPPQPMKLKVEINTREHIAVRAHQAFDLEVDNPWFRGQAEVTTFTLDELLGTKLRALYQRKKGRDVLDLVLPLDGQAGVAPADVVECFQAYIQRSGLSVSRAQFEANLAAKRLDPVFLGDVRPLLRQDARDFDVASGVDRVLNSYVSLLPGDPWKGKQ